MLRYAEFSDSMSGHLMLVFSSSKGDDSKWTTTLCTKSSFIDANLILSPPPHPDKIIMTRTKCQTVKSMTLVYFSSRDLYYISISRPVLGTPRVQDSLVLCLARRHLFPPCHYPFPSLPASLLPPLEGTVQKCGARLFESELISL